ncbi:MAG: hypothetical protein KAR05_04790 [Candidatus Omnitrophica bacterium]|nr:hypothetical protein [Candidatus Omnitrophota bacterium]
MCKNKEVIFVLLCLMWGHVLLNDVFAGAVAKRQRQQRQQMMKQKMAQQKMMQMRQIKKQQAVARQQAIAQQQAGQKVAAEGMMIQKIEQEMINRNTLVADIVNLDQLVAALDRSSNPWELVIDDEAKEAVVYFYINRYRQEGVRINKGPFFYVKLIDTMAREQPDMLTQPFAVVLKILSIIEYDFDNGQSKDFLARQVLGEQGYRENKKRLGRM